MNVAHWLPIDAAASATGISPYLSAMDRRVLEAGGGRPIAMSQFGHKVLTGRRVWERAVRPHGVDTAVFKPLEDREGLRERLGLKGKFVIGINAANQDPVRKAFPEQMAAFAQFHQKHPDTILGIHARTQTRMGVDLVRIAADLDIQDSRGLRGPVPGGLGLMGTPTSQSGTECWTCSATASYGEGFGLPDRGGPGVRHSVITTAFAAMIELTGADGAWPTTPIGTGGINLVDAPLSAAIAAAYESAYEEAAPCGRTPGRSR